MRQFSERACNDAKTGAKMVDLANQFSVVKTRAVDYLTVQMGANDVCTSSESTMTPVSTFRAQLQSAMGSLAASSPTTQVYVISIPNIYQLWEVLKGNSSARSTWALFGIWKSMLANANSTRQADIDRRARARQRNIDFNIQLAQVCAIYPTCRFDNNAVFNTAFSASDVSTRDYFHPSLAGQAKLATEVGTLLAWHHNLASFFSS